MYYIMDTRRELDEVYTNKKLWDDITDHVAASWLTPYKHSASDQGKYFRQQQQRRTEKVDKIQESSGEHIIGASMEGMTTSAIQKEVEEQVEMIRRLQAEFDTLYTDYMKAFEDYKGSMKNKMSNASIGGVAVGNNIFGFKGDNDRDSVYYVNRFGYKRKYQNHGLESAGCPSLEQPMPLLNNIQGEPYASLKLGAGQSGIPCDLEGKVVYNKDERLYGWVAPNGVLHMLPDDTQCSVSNAVQLSSQVFNSMTKGEMLSADHICNTFVDTTNMGQLVALNGSLQEKALEIETEIKNLMKMDDAYQTQIGGSLISLEMKRTQLKENEKLMRHSGDKRRRVEAGYADNTRLYRKEQAEYMGMMGLTVLLGGYLIYKWAS
jgi:hypothetical protein